MVDNQFIYNPFLKAREESFGVSTHLGQVRSYLEIDSKLRSDWPIGSIDGMYQVVIMAAGKGSRMELDYPKTLFELDYPAGRRSIIENLLLVLRKIGNKVSTVDIVIEQGKREHFSQLTDRHDSIRLIELSPDLIQGTARCLCSVKDYLDSQSNIILVWGDLALIPANYIFIPLLVHEKFGGAITMPTRYRLNPYVAFIRNEYGVFAEVYHSQEGRCFRGWAEQDALCFILRSDITGLLEEFLISARNEKQNHELDFVHFVPYCSSNDNTVIGLPICEDRYVQGVNTISKAEAIDSYLRSLSEKEYRSIFLTIT